MKYEHLRPEDFDYELPEHLIAQRPADQRDQSRLLVARRGPRELEHRHVRDLPDILKSGDVLVLNETKVLKARLRLARSTGGSVEVLLLEPRSDGRWLAMAKPLKRLQAGEVLSCPASGEPVLTLTERIALSEEHAEDGEGPGRYVLVEGCGLDVQAWAEANGELPLPPYIKRDEDGPTDADEERYQTVYARVPGAVAAPTAGLHLTPTLLAELEARGVTIAPVVLHVGWGTFAPLTAGHLRQGKLHAERYHVPESTAQLLLEARAEGRRIICVGTTSLRTVETLANQRPPASQLQGSTDIFIAPGYKLAGADGLFTNFHLPKSSLFALICAILGTDFARHTYREAVRHEYRFFSYGDAMIILDE